VVVSRFRTPIRARFVKLYPRTWHGHISMRLELYGCSKGKKIKVGKRTCHFGSEPSLTEIFTLIWFKSEHENL